MRHTERSGDRGSPVVLCMSADGPVDRRIGQPSGMPAPPAYNQQHAYTRPSNRLPALRDRPRAPPRHRRARDGPVGRCPRERRSRRDGFADHAGLPDPVALPDRRRRRRAQAGRRHRRQHQLRRPLRQREAGARAQARPRLAPRGRARPGQERDLHRLGERRRRQVERHRQPGGRAPRRGQDGRRARRRCVGLLTAAHAGPGRRAAARERRAQDRAAPGVRRHQRHLDWVLRRRGRRGRVARPDAPQGAPAVPRGRRVGRARLPAHRPSARHRRCVDDARPAAAAGQVRDRHYAPARGAEGRASVGRDGDQAEARDRRRDREHVRVRGPDRRALPAVRRGRRPAARRGARGAAARRRCR